LLVPSLITLATTPKLLVAELIASRTSVRDLLATFTVKLLGDALELAAVKVKSPVYSVPLLLSRGPTSVWLLARLLTATEYCPPEAVDEAVTDPTVLSDKAAEYTLNASVPPSARAADSKDDNSDLTVPYSEMSEDTEFTFDCNWVSGLRSADINWVTSPLTSKFVDVVMLAMSGLTLQQDPTH
jgi:hypothetical protein